MTVVAEKMFRVLDCIATDDRDAVGLAQLTRRTDIPKATLYRLLCDLASSGLVEHSSRGYSLGPQLFVLGNAVPRYRRLRRVALPHLERLNRHTADTVHLAALQGERVVVLEKVHGAHRVRIPTTVGTRLPLHSTAAGKTILAHGDAALAQRVLGSALVAFTRHTLRAPGLLERQLERCRADGVAVESEETFAGVGCVAVPVRDGDGALVAALSVSGDPASRSARPLVREVLAAAHGIERELQPASAA